METLQPKLRFPEFKGDWEEKIFEDIYSFRSTNSLSRDKLNYNNGLVKNIHYGDIHTKFNTLFNIENELVPFINEDLDLQKISEDNYCKEKDLIIADASEDYNDIGKTIEIVSLKNEKVLAGLHTFLARPDKTQMSMGFGGYLMKSDLIKNQIKLIAQGTKVLSLSTVRVNKLKTIITTLEEQTKIANFLTSIDTKINQLTQKKTLLEQYKKGVMQKIFNQELRFKYDDGKDFPEWKIKKLGEIAEIKRGLASQHLKYVSVANEGVRLLRINDFLSNDAVYIEKTLETQKYKVSTNDLLIAGTGATAGIIFIIPEKFNNLPFSYNAPRIKILKAHFKYVYYYLKSDIIIKQQKRLFVGNAQPFLDTDAMRGFVINLPNIEEQFKIANFLSAIDDKINHVSRQLEKTKEYKKGLLQQMFV